MDNIIRVYRNEKTEIIIKVKNKSPLIIPWLIIEDFPGNLNTSTRTLFVVSLKPREEKKLKYFINPHSRGAYKIHPLTASFNDPFSLFSWKKESPEPLSIIVYPDIILTEQIHRTGLPSGNLKTNNKIYNDINRYRSIREYIPGDNLKLIHWKVSAKMGELHTIEPLPTLYYHTIIILNLNAEDYPFKKRHYIIERAIEIAASLASYYISIGQGVGLVSTGELEQISDNSNSMFIPVKKGAGQGTAILEMMALIKPSYKKNAKDFTRILLDHNINIPVGTQLIIISPDITISQINFLNNFRKKLHFFIIEGKNNTALEEVMVKNNLKVVSSKNGNQI